MQSDFNNRQNRNFYRRGFRGFKRGQSSRGRGGYRNFEQNISPVKMYQEHQELKNMVRTLTSKLAQTSNLNLASNEHGISMAQIGSILTTSKVVNHSFEDKIDPILYIHEDFHEIKDTKLPLVICNVEIQHGKIHSLVCHQGRVFTEVAFEGIKIHVSGSILIRNLGKESLSINKVDIPINGVHELHGNNDIVEVNSANGSFRMQIVNAKVKFLYALNIIKHPQKPVAFSFLSTEKVKFLESPSKFPKVLVASNLKEPFPLFTLYQSKVDILLTKHFNEKLISRLRTLQLEHDVNPKTFYF